MDWVDDGFVLAATRFGEHDAVVEALTRARGRHLGLVKGGMSRTRRPDLQAGNLVSLSWRARLADQLGRFEIEGRRAYAAMALDTGLALAGVEAATAVAAACLPEREAHPALFESFGILMEALTLGDGTLGPAVYVRWEVGLLQELGFALDLAKCALTGTRDDLAYVSPRTGRAVAREAAGIYADRLLRLPPFLLGSQAGAPEGDELADGFRLTGHFLERMALEPHGRRLPAARGRYLDIALR